MWRLLVLALVGPVWAEGDLGEEDAGYLERRLDDLVGLDAASMRWRVRGAEVARERWQLYQRVEVAPVSGQAFFGLAERDVGESGWSDFRTFYYAVQRQRSEWVIGDLRPGTGAGLVFGRNRRGSIAPRMPAGDSRRLGYRSSGENHALRGAAWRYEGRAWSGMLLGGWAHRDGRLDEQGQVRSLPESGYHVTATEVAGRDLLGIRAGGGRLHWRGEHWQWGTTLLALDFSHYIDLRRNGRTPWGFVGDEQRMGAVDVRVAWDRGRVALEVAGDGVGHWGMVGELRGRYGGLRLRTLGRYYAPGFHSFFGAAPGTSAMQNEQGGVAEVSGRGWRGYVDVYRRPARSYFIPVPATYATWGGELRRRLGHHWAMRGQWQRRLRPHWADERLVQERSHKWRLDLEWGDWRWRGELVRWHRAARAEWGLLGSVRFKTRWLTLHVSRFRTDSWWTRIYEYEVDLPGAVSIRPLYGTGWRGYALVEIAYRGWRLSSRYRIQRDQRLRHYGGVQIDWTRGHIDKH